MKVRFFIFVVLFLGLLSSAVLAAPTNCPQQYLGGQAPDFLNQKLAAKAEQICYDEFALIYSGITRTPLLSAEHLTQRELEVKHPRRHNAFHPDPNVPPAYSAELHDYARSGFDRGHMAPSGDMPDKRSQYQSFSLANIVPQVPQNNRFLWEGIEAATRKLAKKDGQLYVVTGPIFHGPNLQRIGGRVLVPTYLFKAIYDPAQNGAGAYLVPNAPGNRYAVISIAKLDQLSGISVFVALPQAVKEKAMDLPVPRTRGKMAAVRDENIVPRIGWKG